jgi:hypothetical protein
MIFGGDLGGRATRMASVTGAPSVGSVREDTADIAAGPSNKRTGHCWVRCVVVSQFMGNDFAGRRIYGDMKLPPRAAGMPISRYKEPVFPTTFAVRIPMLLGSCDSHRPHA